MAEPFLAEIKILSFNYAPKGWAMCNGQLLPIDQNQALFSLLGTTFGGDGTSTFALPDLRGRMPFHGGDPLRPGDIQPRLTFGKRGGEEQHTLTVPEVPQHTHLPRVGSAADQSDPTGRYWGNGGTTALYSAPANTAMASVVSSVGGQQPHTNMPPFLTLNFCIALQGILPLRS